MATDDVTLGELARRLDDISGAVHATDDRTRAMDTRLAVLETQLSAHIAAQAGRTTARDQRCAAHETLIQGFGTRLQAVEGSASQDVGSRRSWQGVVQTTATAAALSGAVIALWKG